MCRGLGGVGLLDDLSSLQPGGQLTMPKRYPPECRRKDLPMPGAPPKEHRADDGCVQQHLGQLRGCHRDCGSHRR